MTKTNTPPMPVGIIDLGAHSIRLEIFQLNADRSYKPIENLSQPVNIGREVFSKGVISSKSINLICSIMRDFAVKLREYGVSYYRAIATSAVREALNREIFIDRIKNASRIKINVLDVTEESRLIYLSIKNNLINNGCKFDKSNILFLTLGTGSTGVAISKQGALIESESFGFGSLRLYEELGENEFAPQRLNGIMDSFATSLDRLLDIQREERNIKSKTPLFVSAGAGVRLIVKLAGKELEQDSMVKLTAKDLEKVSDYLIGKTIEELAEKIGEVDYLVKSVEPCCYLLRQMCRLSDVTSVIIPAISTREAVIEEVIRDIFNEEDPFIEDITSAAIALGEKYRNETSHGKAVAETAVKIFDAVKRFHKLDSRYRMLLYLAGILHDVGRFIDSRKHHKHSHYIIKNSQIPGLSDNEENIIALISRYHRKAEPKTNHSEYMAMSNDDKVIVCKLAAILRVADALDRAHQFKMKNASVTIRKRSLVISVGMEMDLTLERLYVKRKSNLFRNVFGIKIILE